MNKKEQLISLIRAQIRRSEELLQMVKTLKIENYPSLTDRLNDNATLDRDALRNEPRSKAADRQRAYRQRKKLGGTSTDTTQL